MRGLTFGANVLRYWLPAAVAATILAGLVYLVVQQEMRLSANDVQVQMAEDAAAALASGASVETVVPQQTVDVGRSLAPFVMVFDAGGRLVASSGRLNGQPPVLPSGVLDYVRQRGEDRITWQPQPGVRLATVVTRVEGGGDGFVVAARSLREVERRIDELLPLVAVVWLAALGATFVIALVMAGVGVVRVAPTATGAR